MRRFLGVCILLGATCVVGCGSGETIWVKGVLQKEGQVYKPSEGRKVALYFYPIKDESSGATNSEVEMADYDPKDGSFTVPGHEGYGIAPGTYRIAIVETLRREELDKLNKASKPKRGQQRHRLSNDTNFLEGPFGEKTSPFVRELKSSTSLTLDMAKPTE